MKKVLVIDDNKEFLSLVKESLGESCIVEGLADFRSAREVIGKMIEFLPDVVLLDINLGYFSGIELLREMRRNSSLKDIPVIVVTASEYNKPTEMLLKTERNVIGFYSKLDSIEIIKEKINLMK